MPKNREMKKRLVVLSGAGISAESGLSTFRDAGGLWEGHDVYEVATPQGWQKNRQLVLNFYNARRRQLILAKPNGAHIAIASLEQDYEVTVVTQNVDDLHERAGSTQVIHLHGELMRARSSNDNSLSYYWEEDISDGDLAEDGAQLRPDIVWFGEQVPLLANAVDVVKRADIVLVIGTSLQVYPAASLVGFVKKHCEIYYIDPRPEMNYEMTILKEQLKIISENAVNGMQILSQLLFQKNIN